MNTFFKLLRKPCVKCGFTPFSGQTQCVKNQVPGHGSEFLKLTCKRCGYSWEIKPRDGFDEIA